ncbi:MAG: hypothetical protein ACRDLR_09815, partial [Gaiellaceae bacterium]
MTTKFAVKLDGEDLGIFDFDALDLRDGFAIKAASGLTPSELFDGMGKLDPDAFQTAVWFLRSKQGIHAPRSTINFVYSHMEMTPIEDEGDESPNLSTPSTGSE